VEYLNSLVTGIAAMYQATMFTMSLTDSYVRDLSSFFSEVVDVDARLGDGMQFLAKFTFLKLLR
jgi:hypothetical protein